MPPTTFDNISRVIGESNRENNGLYYLVGMAPKYESITYESIFDRSSIDVMGYPFESYKVTDKSTGVSSLFHIGQKVRLKIEVGNPMGMGYGGNIERIFKAEI